MASAVEELTQTHAASITRASTLLIDDDVNNVSPSSSLVKERLFCSIAETSESGQFPSALNTTKIVLNHGIPPYSQWQAMLVGSTREGENKTERQRIRKRETDGLCQATSPRASHRCCLPGITINFCFHVLPVLLK